MSEPDSSDRRSPLTPGEFSPSAPEAEPPVLGYARESPRHRNPWVGLAKGVVISVFLLLFALILFPFDAGSHELSPRALCAANLRKNGQGLHIYASDHGVFPPGLGTLISNNLSISDDLICPCCKSSGNRKCDYAYVTELVPGDPSHWIVAFDLPGNHSDGGANVLYVDGHVDYRRASLFTAELAAFRREFEQARGHPPHIRGID